ncbi:trehalose phosphatase [Aureococcus anophagefferens]|uniref:Trehalose phosphatase n=1 Tax=Aureococcus anophagefferens TaxID=44056 RepID=A0ABR1G0Y6_AURAN
MAEHVARDPSPHAATPSAAQLSVEEQQIIAEIQELQRHLRELKADQDEQEVPELVENYYNGFCNDVLWPLFHYVPLPMYQAGAEKKFDAHLWDAYTGEPPPPEAVMEVYKGDGADSKADASKKKKKLSSGIASFSGPDVSTTTPKGIEFGGRFCSIGVFPIGIDPLLIRNTLRSRAVKKRTGELGDTFEGRKIIIGVDRLDYIKGMPHKLLAFELFLSRNPSWVGKVTLIQTLAKHVNELVGRINGVYGTLEYSPIHYINQSIPQDELIAIYHLADARASRGVRGADGMNLVSHEYVAAQEDVSDDEAEGEGAKQGALGEEGEGQRRRRESACCKPFAKDGPGAPAGDAGARHARTRPTDDAPRERRFMDKWLGKLKVGLAAEFGYCHRAPDDEQGVWKSLGRELDTSWKDVVRPIMQYFAERTPAHAKDMQIHMEDVMSNLPLEIIQGNRLVRGPPAGVNKCAVLEEVLRMGPRGETVRERPAEASAVATTPGAPAATSGSAATSPDSARTSPGASRTRASSKADVDFDFVLCVGDDRSDEDMYQLLKAWHARRAEHDATRARRRAPGPARPRPHRHGRDAGRSPRRRAGSRGAAIAATISEIFLTPVKARAPPTMPRGLAIFDFDCTLTRFHVWGKFRNAPLKEVPIDAATFVDLPAFRAFVSRARGADVEVAIATFGRRDVVDKAMTFALGEAHGVAISTPADHADPRFDFGGGDDDDDDRPRCAEGSDILGDKNTQIDELLQRVGVDVGAASLADDDPHNVAAARQRGVYCEHTPQGCDATVLERLLARFDIA